MVHGRYLLVVLGEKQGAEVPHAAMPVPEKLWPNRPVVRHVGAPVSAGSRVVAVRQTQKIPFLEPDHCGQR